MSQSRILVLLHQTAALALTLVALATGLCLSGNCDPLPQNSGAEQPKPVTPAPTEPGNEVKSELEVRCKDLVRKILENLVAAKQSRGPAADAAATDLGTLANLLEDHPDLARFVIDLRPDAYEFEFDPLIRVVAHSSSDEARAYLERLCHETQGWQYSALNGIISWYARDPRVYGPTDLGIEFDATVDDPKCFDFLQGLLADRESRMFLGTWILGWYATKAPKYCAEAVQSCIELIRSDAEEDLRTRAADTIGCLAVTKEQGQALRVALQQEKNPEVKLAIILALYFLTHDSDNEAAAIALVADSKDIKFIKHSLYRLAYLGPARLPVLQGLIRSHGNPDVRAAALDALANDFDQQTGDAVLAAATEEQSLTVRSRIVEWCRNGPHLPGKSKILAYLLRSDESAEFREKCARALSPANPESRQALERAAVDDSSESVRKAAAQSLAEAGSSGR